MSPVLVLAAAWLLVVGYGLIYIGYKNLNGQAVSFAQAFLGGALGSTPSSASSSAGGSSVVSGTSGTAQRTL